VAKRLSEADKQAQRWGPPSSEEISEEISGGDLTGDSDGRPELRFGPNRSGVMIGALIGASIALSAVLIGFLVLRDAPTPPNSSGTSETSTPFQTTPLPTYGTAPTISPLPETSLPAAPKAVVSAMTAASTKPNTFAISNLHLGPNVRLASGVDGRLYVSDPRSRAVYAISEDNKTVDIIAGSRTGIATIASILRSPGPIVIDSFGSLIIADQPTAGTDGRLIRVDPNGNISEIISLQGDAIHLYADESGNVFAQVRGVPWEPSKGDTLVRITPVNKIDSEKIGSNTSQLIAVSGGRWLAVDSAGSLRPVSLFGSSVNDLVKITFEPQPSPSVLAAGSTFVTHACGSPDYKTCELRAYSAAGDRLSTSRTEAVTDFVSRSGGVVVATHDGGLKQFATKDVSGASTVLTEPKPINDTGDSNVTDSPADLTLSPISITVAPDGTIYWLDGRSGAPTLYAGTPDGGLYRLSIPNLPNARQIAARPDGLLVWSAIGVLHLLPYDTLTVGNEGARSEASAKPLLVVGKLSPNGGIATSPTEWFYLASNKLMGGKRALLGLPSAAGALAVDSTGMAAIVNEGGSSVTIYEFGLPPVVAAEASAAAAASKASLLGLPEGQIGRVGGIASIGPAAFVVTDTGADRLSLLERNADGMWIVSRFVGAAPTTVSGSPLSQRTVGPRLIAAAPDGSVIFTTDDGAIRRMDRGGTIRLFIGGAEADRTTFGSLSGVATYVPNASNPTERNVIVADTARHRVLSINRDGSLGAVLGTGIQGPDIADLDSPGAIATGAGLIVVADTGNHRVLTQDGAGLTQVVAGTGFVGRTEAAGPATQVSLNSPQGVAITDDGRIIISDTDNNRVLLVDRNGVISELMTTAKPTGLALQDQNHVLVTGSSDGQVIRVSLINKSREIFAGRGTPGFTGDGGPAIGAQLNTPMAIAVGPDGSVYISDSRNSAIRRVDPKGIITTIAGRDGSSTTPTGIVIDPVFGIIFGDIDGRLLSINATELSRIVPGWDTAAAKK
jgi:sugar lactone lactonase YvrE